MTPPNESVELKTYRVHYFCSNCGHRSYLQVPMGVLAYDYLSNLECIICGCKKLEKSS